MIPVNVSSETPTTGASNRPARISSTRTQKDVPNTNVVARREDIDRGYGDPQPMTAPVRPTYQAIVDQALNVTGASSAWLLRSTDDGLVVSATAGLAAREGTLHQVIDATGAKGFALSSGQPVALLPPPNDPANDGAAGFPGVPTSVLAAPCGIEIVLGVLELADKDAGKPFTFDDIGAVSALAAIAGAAMTEHEGAPPDVASPAELATELERLASESPRRYADTARVIESLLAPGA